MGRYQMAVYASSLIGILKVNRKGNVNQNGLGLFNQSFARRRKVVRM